jgi:CDP-diacylglycerol--serine O-phosphatidyltransferase
MTIRDMLRIPNLLSLANAGCGLAAILLLLGAIPLAEPANIPAVAASLIFVAFLCDMLDGVAARMTGPTGPFGAVLDSLADTVSFGIAPATMIPLTITGHALASPWPELATGLSFLFAACVMLRLARYTHDAVIETGHAPAYSPRVFEGLPSPAAGMMIAAAVLVSEGWGGLIGPVGGAAAPWVMLLFASTTPLLMVGTARFPDLPKFYAARRLPTWHLVIVPVILILIGPGQGLAVIGIAYLSLGPLLARAAA